MGNTETKGGRSGLVAAYTGISAGCAGIDTAIAYGIATVAKAAVPTKIAISGLTFGVSFAFAFLALCMCKAASDADDYMDELQERSLN